MRIRNGAWYALFAAVFIALLLYAFFPALHISAITKQLRPYSVHIWDVFGLVALLFVLIGLGYLRWGWRAYSQGISTALHSRLLVDRPIASSNDDAFNTAHFAGVLARELVLPAGHPSVVIALEGPWGCGKSSLLNMIEKELRTYAPPPVVVHFNPWILGTVDDLVDRFFCQLAEESAAQGAAPPLVAALDGMRRTIERDRLDGIARLAVQISQVAARALEKPKTGRDVLSRKEGISDLLDRLDRSVVVLVDDVDRLAPEQIQAVFQLIRTMGDFNRVGYLIAYDPKPVYSALDHQCRGYGKEYKDKIVQVTVPFPSHRLSKLEAYFRATWNKAVDDWKVAIGAEHGDLFEQCVPVILRTIHTPRHIRIVVNDTFLRASLTKAEIALPDLLAFAALGVRFPQIISIIRDRPTLATRRAPRLADAPRSVRGPGTGSDATDPLRTEVLKALSNPLDVEQADALLQFLFPLEDPRNVGVLGRLREENNLFLMLYASSGESIFSNAEAEKLLYSPGERETILDAHQIGRTITGFLIFAISGVSPNRAIPALNRLVESLVTRCAAIYREHDLDLTSEFAQFAFHLLLHSGCDDISKREAIRSAIFSTRFLSLGHELFVRLLRYLGAWDSGKWQDQPYRRRGRELDWLSDSEVNELRDEWLDVVAQCPIDLLISRETQPVGILHRRAQFVGGNYGDVQAELTAWLEVDLANVRRFSDLFPGGVSFAGTERLVGSEYDLVAAFKRAGVDVRQIERLQEDCPSLGALTTEPAGPARVPEEIDLSLPVSYESLVMYTSWKFPDKPVSDRLQKYLLRDLNISKYPTLLEIDQAVQRAEEAVNKYAQEQAEWFKFGTDHITKSLGFVDEEFRVKHGFANKTRAAFKKYATLVKPKSP